MPGEGLGDNLLVTAVVRSEQSSHSVCSGTDGPLSTQPFMMSYLVTVRQITQDLSPISDNSIIFKS